MKWIVSIAFVLAMGAGVAVGMLGARLPVRHDPHSWLVEQLNLSATQRDQMQAIWQELAKNRPRDFDRRRALDKERSDAVAAILSEDQKARYDAINQQYAAKLQELSKQRDEAFQAAIEKSKQILTSDQRVKYEAMLQKRHDGGDHGPGEHGGDRVSDRRGDHGPGMGWHGPDSSIAPSATMP